MSGRGTKGILAAIFLVGLAGCETVYKAATEERPLSVLVDDEVITTKIKKGFFDSVIPALGLSVFCHQGLVVLAGVADPQICDKAVAVARAIEGVVTVKSFLQLKAR